MILSTTTVVPASVDFSVDTGIAAAAVVELLGSNQYYCRLERHKQWCSSGKQATSNHYLVATLMLLPLCRLSVVPLVDMDDDVYLPLKMAPAMTVPSLPRPPPLLPLSTQT